jgi:hypothetical protein
MATIINNPTDTRPVVTDESPVGMIVGLIVALVLVVLFVMYVLPSFRASTVAPADTTPGASANINLTVPSGSTNGGGTSGGSTQ